MYSSVLLLSEWWQHLNCAVYWFLNFDILIYIYYITKLTKKCVIIFTTSKYLVYFSNAVQMSSEHCLWCCYLSHKIFLKKDFKIIYKTNQRTHCLAGSSTFEIFKWTLSRSASNWISMFIIKAILFPWCSNQCQWKPRN